MVEFIQVAVITLLTLALALAISLIAVYFIVKIALYFAKEEDKENEDDTRSKDNRECM